MRYSSKPVMMKSGGLGSSYASITSNLSIIEEEPPVLPPRYHHIRKQRTSNCDGDSTTEVLSRFTAKACVSLFGVDGLLSCQNSICLSISDALTPKMDDVQPNITAQAVDSEDTADDSTAMDLNQLVYGTKAM